MEKSVLLRMGIRRISVVARENLYLHAGIDVTIPESIHCEINEHCNYRCEYCHFWRLDNYAPEMGIEDWKRVLLELKSFTGRQPIKFIGGEPFIRKGFVDLLEFCRLHDIRWGVTTNGSAFSQAVVDRVVAARPSNIDVSVDSPDAAVNDEVRGAPGSLRRIEQGLRRLRDARDRSGATFPIRIKPTITRKNFRTLEGFADWALEHGADTVDMKPVHSVPFWTAKMRDDLWPTPPECEEMRAVMARLVAQRSAGKPIETGAESLHGLPDQFLGRSVRTAIPGPCRAGLRDMTIKTNGDVSTCWDFPAIGNVRSASLREIWHGSPGKSNRRDTVACAKVGGECANSCLDHRSLGDDIRRGVMMLAARA